MSNKQAVRNSLFKSSLSIKGIRESVGNFGKGLRDAGKNASDIVKQTGESNQFKRTLIGYDNKFFRKRREAVRRRQREDEIESATTGGVIKKQGSILSTSTKGFLGRILDFFGIILIGWLIRTLPSIIRSVTQLITNIRKVVSVLTNFVGNIMNVVLGFGEQLGGVLRQISGIEIDTEERKLKEELEKAEGGFFNLNEGLLKSFEALQDPKTFGLPSFDMEMKGNNQWWDFMELFPNKELEVSEVEQDEEPSTDEKNEVEEDESEQNKSEENIEGVEVAPKPEDLGSGSDESFSQNEIDDEVQDNAIQEAKFDKGGEVKGVSGIDQIPAKLTKGEFVIQKAIAEKNKEFLKMYNSGKLSPIKESINEAKQGIDLDAFTDRITDRISNFDSDKMMSGINSAVSRVDELPFDKLNDFIVDSIDGIGSREDAISPKINETKTKVDKINSGKRKPKTTVIMMNNVINRGGGSSSSPQMVSTSKKSTPRSGSSLNMVELVQLSELSFT